MVRHLLVYFHTDLVRKSRMLVILFSMMCVGLDLVTALSKSTRNWRRADWYITFTLLSSTIRK